MRTYIIDERSAGTKLFAFVQKIAPVIKNGDLFKIIRKGVIEVNEKKVDFSYRLKENDEISLYLAEEYFVRQNASYNFPHSELDIVFEDNSMLIINKPRGLLIHSDGKEYKDNLVEYIKGYLYRKKAWNPTDVFTPTIANRLDYNTSGIVVAAKNHKTLQDLTKYFRKRLTDKKYYALVYKRVEKDLFITSLISPKVDEDNMMIASDTIISQTIPDKEQFIEQNPTLSAMVVNSIYSTEDISLVSVDLWTGRKHQIRCQLNAAGYPLLGDFKYYTPQSVKVSNIYGFDGYFLHSYALDIPEKGSWTSIPDKRFREKLTELFPTVTLF